MKLYYWVPWISIILLSGITSSASPVSAHSSEQVLNEAATTAELADLAESGEQLLDEGQISAALARYQHMLSLDRENSKVFSAIGYIQALMNNFEESAIAFQQYSGQN